MTVSPTATGKSVCPTGFFDTTIEPPLSLEIAGTNIIFLAVESVVYFLICLMIEFLLTFPAVAAFFNRVRDPGDAADEIDVVRRPAIRHESSNVLHSPSRFPWTHGRPRVVSRTLRRKRRVCLKARRRCVNH